MGRRTTELVLASLRVSAMRQRGDERAVLVSLCLKMQDWLDTPAPVPVKYDVVQEDRDAATENQQSVE